jgi:hypothetical protein
MLMPIFDDCQQIINSNVCVVCIWQQNAWVKWQPVHMLGLNYYLFVITLECCLNDMVQFLVCFIILSFCHSLTNCVNVTHSL